MTALTTNRVYHGDNLTVLRRRIPDACIDLAYIDPPFNSRQYYRGNRAGQRRQGFVDVWPWTPQAARAYAALTQHEHSVSAMLRPLGDLLGPSSMLAYLAMMAPRLAELHRVLHPRGTLYVHCDPSASHYLKVCLDHLFGAAQFRNEIVWRRTAAHGTRRSFAPIHDTLLVYSKSDAYYFDSTPRRPYMRGHVTRRYTTDAQGRLKFASGGNILTGPGTTRGDSCTPWRGFDPASKNRHWAIPRFLSAQMPPGFGKLPVSARLEALLQARLIEIRPNARWPTPVRFLETRDGQALSDIWAYQPYTEGTVHGSNAGIDADVAWLGTTAPERRWYPTQKPEGLLTRIIRSSCPPEGVVLDAFCGCGTTLAAAQRLGRRWLGIDSSRHAIGLVTRRLREQFGVRVQAQRVAPIKPAFRE